MEPSIIFAALAILFALLNIVLWSFVWKNLSGSEDSSIKNANEKNSKIEDQLWGVIDRIKELEEGMGRIEKKISAGGGGGGDSNKAISKLGKLNKRTAALVQKNTKTLEEITGTIEKLKDEPETLKKMENIFESIDESLARLNSRIKKLEK